MNPKSCGRTSDKAPFVKSECKAAVFWKDRSKKNSIFPFVAYLGDPLPFVVNGKQKRLFHEEYYGTL